METEDDGVTADMPEDDGDFEVTADMLIHDTMDDETTLAEEEALRTQEEDEAELNELQEEGDMPLEQLLALYGYGSAPPTSNEEPGGSTSHAQPKQSDSSSSVRSRRRNKVVPLEPQKEIAFDSSDTKEEESTVSPAPPPEHQSPGGVVSSETGTKPTQEDVLQTETKMQKPSTVSPNKTAKGAWQGQSSAQGEHEDTEGEEVDVVEVDEGLRLVGDKNMLKLDELELNVVRMDDIEAGLRSEGATALRMAMVEGVGLDEQEEGLGGDTEGVGLSEAEEATGEAGSGLDALERKLEEVRSGAVYDDVLLSSGNNRLHSDSTDDPPMTSTEGPSVPPDNTTSGRTYVYGSRLRPEMPERRSMRLMHNDERAMLNSYFASLLSDGSDSESDEEYSPREDWKKEVKVGEGYQAKVPECAPATPYFPSPNSSTSELASAPKLGRPGEPLPPHLTNHVSFRTRESLAVDSLMWNPMVISEEEVSRYLESLSKVVEGVSSDSRKDHELALQVLQKCNHNAKAALKSMQTVPPVQGMKPWTEDECKRFEEGLRSVRKDFFLLQKKVPTRSVKEVVEFYYLWKKSERYDHFIQQYGKIGRKKMLIPPGHVSDFMGKYLDMHSNDAMDVHYMTTTVHTELKKENS